MLFLLIFLSIIFGIISWLEWGFWYIWFFSIFILFFTNILFKFKYTKILICLWFLLIFHNLANISNQERINWLKILTNYTQNFDKKFEIKWSIEKFLFNSDLQKTYKLKIISLENENEIINLEKQNINISVKIPKNLDLNIWDIIIFNWKVRNSIKNPNSWFDKYLWFNKIYGSINLYNFKVNLRAEKNIFSSISDQISEKLIKNFPQDITSLLLGITIWNTDFMTSDIKSEFKNSGLTHILVVSGSNIAFVILIFSFILQYFPIKEFFKYLIIIFFLLLYGSLVGWDTPVIRATIMWIISYISIRKNYRINSIAILFLIAIIFLILEPLSLIYDVSFGLSFSATLWIIIFNPIIEKFIKKYIKIIWISTIISVSLSASLWSFGVLLYHFWTINIVWIFANILIGGVMWVLLIFTTFYILFSFILPDSIIYYLGFPIYLIWEYIFIISEIFGKIESFEISEKIKIPLSIFINFIGFLYIFKSLDSKLKNEKDHQNSN